MKREIVSPGAAAEREELLMPLRLAIEGGSLETFKVALAGGAEPGFVHWKVARAIPHGVMPGQVVAGSPVAGSEMVDEEFLSIAQLCFHYDRPEMLRFAADAVWPEAPEDTIRTRAAGITSMFPEMVTGAQHILNELLLEYPVLMHPRLQVHVYADGNPGTCSVAHAVAMASRGRFPMAGDRGVSRERLQGWVRHASVHLGFQTHAIPVFDRTTSAVTGARPVEAAAKKARSQQWMLASVDQLFELCRSAPEERNRFVGDIVPTDPRGRWTGPGLEAFTVSFFGACGILDGVQCPAFFDVLKRAGYGENASLRSSVVDYSAGYILGGAGIGVTGDIPSRFDAVVMGMVECKLAPSAVAAAEMLWRSIADRSTRQVVVAEALDVVRSVRTAGVTVTVSERDFGTAAKAEPWVHALEVHDAALAMNRVIDHVAPTPVPTSAKPMTRRRRNGL